MQNPETAVVRDLDAMEILVLSLHGITFRPNDSAVVGCMKLKVLAESATPSMGHPLTSTSVIDFDSGCDRHWLDIMEHDGVTAINADQDGTSDDSGWCDDSSMVAAVTFSDVEVGLPRHTFA